MTRAEFAKKFPKEYAWLLRCSRGLLEDKGWITERKRENQTLLLEWSRKHNRRPSHGANSTAEEKRLYVLLMSYKTRPSGIGFIEEYEKEFPPKKTTTQNKTLLTEWSKVYNKRPSTVGDNKEERRLANFLSSCVDILFMEGYDKEYPTGKAMMLSKINQLFDWSREHKRRPSTKSIDLQERVLGELIQSHSDLLTDYNKKFPKQQDIRNLKINQLFDWSRKHNRRPSVQSIDPLEKEMNKILRNNVKAKYGYNKEFPPLSTKLYNQSLIVEFCVKYNKLPKQHTGDSEEHRLAGRLSAYKNDICFMNKISKLRLKRRRSLLTLKDCKQSARSHNNKGSWIKADESACNAARRNGWLNECCEHMKRENK